MSKLHKCDLLLFMKIISWFCRVQEYLLINEATDDDDDADDDAEGDDKTSPPGKLSSCRRL